MRTSLASNYCPAGIRVWAPLILLAFALLGCGGDGSKSADSGTLGAGSGSPDEIPAILEIEDRVASIEALANLLGRLPKTPETAEAVVEHFDAAFIDRGDIELVLVAEWWTPFDAPGAFQWSRGMWRADHPRITYAILRSAARKEPQQAVDLYLKLRTSQELYAVNLQPVVVGWYESGQEGLMSFILGQSNGPLQQLALGTYTRLQVAKLGPEKAIEWAESISKDSGGTLRRQILQRVASAIAELEPEIASKWVENLVLNEGASGTLLRRVAGRWAQRQPAAALEWLEQFPDTKDRRQAVRQTFGIWIARNAPAATEWLLARGDKMGTTYGPAVDQIVRSRAKMANSNPDFSIDWDRNLELAMTIADEETRWASVTQLLRVRILADEESTLAWVEANNVPDVYRYKITAALQKGQGMQRRAPGGA